MFQSQPFGSEVISKVMEARIAEALLTPEERAMRATQVHAASATVRSTMTDPVAEKYFAPLKKHWNAKQASLELHAAKTPEEKAFWQQLVEETRKDVLHPSEEDYYMSFLKMFEQPSR